MTKGKKHLFLVCSDFQYVICKSIIRENALKTEDCFFVSRRGVKLEKEDLTYPFPYEGGFWYYMLHRREVNSFFAGKDISVYVPFRGSFFSKYVHKMNYFEEGLSIFRDSIKISKGISDGKNGKGFVCQVISHLKSILKKILIKEEALFFVDGFYSDREAEPLENSFLYGCSPYALKQWSHPLLEKRILNIGIEPPIKYDVKEGSYFVVLERFSSSNFYDLENYKICLRTIFSYLEKWGVEEIWTKFHPADYKNEHAMEEFEKCREGFNLKVHFFDGRLELLALQNINIHFIAENSTILYYAPVLGSTNKSISFVKLMYKLDERYKGLISQYGGMERFVDFFSKNVECLEP